MTRLLRSFWLAAGLLAASVHAPLQAAGVGQATLYERLARAAPTLDREALRHALAAMQCAVNNGAEPAERLAVIDYSLPSSEQRLWIFDLRRQRLLLQDLVAHGKESGEHHATRFSNVEGSHQSSLGLFRTEESYIGQHGYSLRMDGLEPGINDRARERAIVNPRRRLRRPGLGREARPPRPQPGLPGGAPGSGAHGGRQPQGRAVHVLLVPRPGMAAVLRLPELPAAAGGRRAGQTQGLAELKLRRPRLLRAGRAARPRRTCGTPAGARASAPGRPRSSPTAG